LDRGAEASSEYSQITRTRSASATESASESDSDSYYDDDESGSEYSDDEDDAPGLRGPPQRVVLVEPEALGPIVLKGVTLRLRVILYDGPKQALGSDGDAITAASADKAPYVVTGDGAARYRWRERLRLPPAVVHDASHLMIQGFAVSSATQTEDELVVWGMIPVAVKGRVPVGSQIHPVYRLPIIIANERRVPFDSATLSLRVLVLDTEDAELDRDPFKVAGPGIKAPEEDFPGVPCAAYRMVKRPRPPGNPFQPGDGFVLCVDGARFLPVNVTISRVVARAYTNSGKLLGGTVDALAQLSGSCRSPIYALRQTYHTARWDDATVTLLFHIETVERDTGDVKVVGYASHPVFVSPNTLQQPSSERARGYALNAGAFQIPMHTRAATAVTANSAGLTHAAQASQPRLACASLLVRLIPTLEAGRGENRGLPDYHERAYDSSRCEPSPVEQKVFPKLLALPTGGVKDELLELANADGEPINEWGEAEQLEWASTRLTKNQLTNDAALNYRRSFPYDPELGFSVAVDALNRLSQQAPHYVITSISPPAGFYRPQPIMLDLEFTQEPAFDSPLVAPRFEDGLQTFDNVMYERGLAIVFDVRALVGTLVTPIGWSILPVFQSNCVASGYYQLPLFSGTPRKPLLDELARAKEDDPATVVRNWMKDGRVQLVRDSPSVFVRLAGAQRGDEFKVPIDPAAAQTDLDLSLIPPKQRADYAKPSKSDKTYAKMTPKGADTATWVADRNATFAESTGIVGALKDDADEDSEYTDSDSEEDEDEDEEDDDARTRAS